MSTKIDLTGLKFNRLTVLYFLEKNNWLCICDCGKTTVVSSANLKNNHTKSCGCLAKEVLEQRNVKHGKTYTPFYHVWAAIKRRCNNKNCREYKWYGDKGISYDPRWEDFIEFKKDMYLKYLYAKKHLKMRKPSIERKDVNGNYCKENCCWIPIENQWKNLTISNKKYKWFKAISPNGKEYKSKYQTQFAKEHGLWQADISNYLRNKTKGKHGWKFFYI